MVRKTITSFFHDIMVTIAFHKGNAFLTNVTADNLRTIWKSWQPSVVDDSYATLIVDSLSHAKYFNTRNFAVVSLNVKLFFNSSTPSPYATVAISLPQSLRIRADSHFRSQCIAERETNTQERKFSISNISVDGKTRGGADNNTYIYLDRIFIQNLGQFVAGQTYEVKGQITFEPSL